MSKISARNVRNNIKKYMRASTERAAAGDRRNIFGTILRQLGDHVGRYF